MPELLYCFYHRDVVVKLFRDILWILSNQSIHPSNLWKHPIQSTDHDLKVQMFLIAQILQNALNGFAKPYLNLCQYSITSSELVCPSFIDCYGFPLYILCWWWKFTLIMLTKIYFVRVAKCHRFGGLIRVKKMFADL